MEPHEYITILRRRWPVIVGFFMLGVVLALVAPTSDPVSSATLWRAQAVLAPVALDGTGSPVGDVGLLAESDAVLQGVVQDLPGLENPDEVAALTDASLTDSGALAVSAVGASDDEAEELANTFARRLAEQAGSQATVLREQQIALLRARLERLGPPTVPGDPAIEAERDRLAEQIAQLEIQADFSPFVLLQPAVARPEQAESALAPPSDPLARMLLFGGVGLLVGVVIALVVERVDPRLLTPSEMGRAYRIPVLMSLPRVPPTRDGVPFISLSPESPEADGLRALRMSLLLASPQVPGAAVDSQPARHRAATARAPQRPAALDTSRVVLFTAGRSGVGVTATVTNLAVAFAASGMSVVVLDADQRGQSLTAELGLRGRRGVSDLLAQPTITGRDVMSVSAVSATLPGVRVLTAGSSLAFRGADPSRTEQLLVAAREVAQIVLIDAAALLESVEALELAPFVDGVVIMARTGGVTREGADQVSSALSQLGIPAFGLVAVTGRAGTRARSTLNSLSRRWTGRPGDGDLPTEPPGPEEPRTKGRHTGDASERVESPAR